ncbi:MAG TPA: glucosamine-6-phosphate deaminase [Acholeplasmataceae bacterium]|nr:glucosamine-6-phosphate deaminase [Acholeplasmataceae bacterium]
MKVKVFDNSALLYDYLCEKVISKIKENPNITLGLPTGSTPIPLYERLIQAYIDHKVDFANVASINLDEYVGLGPTHNQSYRYFMDNTLFDHININKANTFVPNGMAKDLKQECENYHNLLVLKKVDLQILGIGTNAHIAFNEPGSSFESITRVVPLSKSTRNDNRRFFKKLEDVPKKAISMGISDILLAKKIIIVAVGSHKAEAIKNMIQGPITEEVPASALQMHSDVLVLLDQEAAKLL